MGRLNLEIKGKIPEIENVSAESEGYIRVNVAKKDGVCDEIKRTG